VVVVAGIRGRNVAFHFEIVVSDLLEQRAWRGEDDPILYVTKRYVRAPENTVIYDPTHYLRAHARRDPDLACRLTGEAQPADAER